MNYSYIKEYANDIYRILGPGHSERIYHNAMEVILRKNHIPYETERIVPIYFEEHVIGNMRADIIVDGKIVLELKAVKSLNISMEWQALNYLKQTGIEHALLVNFPQTQATSCECVDIDRCKETSS